MLFANYPQFYWTTRSEQNLGIRGQRHGAVRSVTLVRQNFVRQKVRTDPDFWRLRNWGGRDKTQLQF